MSEGLVGLLILLAVSTGAALVTHALDRRIVRASVIAAVIATIVFHSMVYLREGGLDPFFPIAVVVGGAVSFVIAMGVGMLFWKLRPQGRSTPGI